MSEKSAIEHREIRFHDDPFDNSNWCAICGLYYCWHPEVKEHRNDDRANHKFVASPEGKR